MIITTPCLQLVNTHSINIYLSYADPGFCKGGGRI